MQDDKKSFVRALSSLLSYRGLSQRELADKIGCTEAAVSAWLKGKSSPTQKRLHKIAEALRVDVAYLIGDFPLFDENGLPNFEPDPVEKPPTAEEVYGKPEGTLFGYPVKDYTFKDSAGRTHTIEEAKRESPADLDALIQRLTTYSVLLTKWEKLDFKQRDSVMSFIDFQLSEEGK
jgi:transcriptional regulator with XRE-family HTH domain